MGEEEFAIEYYKKPENIDKATKFLLAIDNIIDSFDTFPDQAKEILKDNDYKIMIQAHKNMAKGRDPIRGIDLKRILEESQREKG